MQIISRQSAGILTIAGLIASLLYVLIFGKPAVIGLALVLIVLMATIFLYRPDWGLLIFIVIRPMIDKFSDSISIPISQNLSINASALLGVFILGLSGLFFLKNKTRFLSIPLAKAWLLFIAISVASIFISVDSSASFYEVIRILTILSVFFLAFSIYQTNQNPSLFLKTILVSAVIPFLFAFYQLVTQTGLGGTSGIDSRLFGTFVHPNAFASFILIIFAVATFFILTKKTTGKITFYLIIFISLFLIVETFSRGAWLSLLVFVFIISIFKSRKIILATLALLIISILVSPLVRDRIKDVYNPPATSSIVWRFEQWNKVYGAFIKRPLTGYGSGTETIVYENENGFNAGNPYTHNDILKTALETGIFGSLAFTGLLVSTVILLFYNFIKSKDIFSKNLTLVVLALFAVQIVFSMTSNIFRGTATQWILWALVGITLNKKVLSGDKFILINKKN